jgi:hypothetical protein
MKKLFALIMVAAALLAVAMLPSLGIAADAPAKIGLGHVTSIGSSKDKVVAANGKVTPAVAQVDTTMAIVAFDAAGRVTHITIDTAQTKVNYDEDMKVTSDLAALAQSKIELGDGYGMRKASSIKKEWNEQIVDFEKWMIGKTVAEIKALKTKQRDASHIAVPDIPELASTVTITVQDYIEVVEEAWNNAVPVPAGGVKLGLGHEISIAKSTSSAAQVDNVFAGALFDKDGKIVGVIVDTAQTKVAFDKDGKVTTDKAGEFLTKKELREGYGMLKASSIKKEWYEQMAEFEKWMTGKTVAEIKALKTKQRDSSHIAVPDIPELASTVTITVEGYIAAVAEAYANAK